MCDDSGTRAEAFATTPREAVGTAIDPIAVEPVDEITITTLVDNSYDALMGDTGPARRTPGLIAEHGFSALVTTRRGDRSHTLLFDTGISPDGMATNFERLGLDASAIEAVVLSHGHADSDGGFPGPIRLRGRSGLPLTVHPLVFSRRRFALLGARPRWSYRRSAARRWRPSRSTV